MMNHVKIIPIPTTAEYKEQQAWRFPVETESEIVALAAVCRLKRQQREPLEPATEGDSGRWSDDEELDDEDDCVSLRIASLTTDSTKTIKRTFLDRLAEILCSHKHASYVTCTSMIEYEDAITIVVARNAKWTDADVRILDGVAAIMEKIASRGVCKNLFPCSCTSNAHKSAKTLSK